MQPFAIYHQEKPRWIHFKCFYHNFKNEQREFLLQIAPKERIAKISRTQHGNTYYGVVVRLHDSFALFLHTLNQDSPSRVIFLNIPVGGTKLSVKSQRFAIYSNNDIINGSPYSQVMLLCRLDDEQEYDEKEFEFDQYVPFLKEKKIGIAEELWNGVDQPFNKLNEDYMYHFDTSARNIFYDNLKGHLSNARSEIYFLGLAPIHFPHSDQGKMQAYFKMHEELIREKQIRIHRLILEPLVARDFKESLKAIKRDPEIADYYKLYVARQPIPVLQDLILIDPEDAHMQTAILAFIKMRKNGDISMPIRMEVIRKNFQIIGSLYDTCRKFIDNNELVEELSTVADIDAKLLVGDG